MKKWLTSAEIASLALSGLPRSKPAIAQRAEREGWPVRMATGLGGTRKLYQVPGRYSSGMADQSTPEGSKVQGVSALEQAADYVAEARKHGQLSDAELVQEIVMGVEHWLDEKHLHPSPAKKAALISLLFKYFQESGALDGEKMDELLKAVA